MNLIVDNCLPVSWVPFLILHGHTARHWREIGPANAADAEIIRRAVEDGAIVLTHDLDFTKLLFQSGAHLPSVIQLRLDDVRPANIGKTILLVLARHAEDLSRGALVSVEAAKTRCRLLPLP